MSKTPVSILQEMMVKKQMIPNFELIHDGGGTHDNTFTYRVSCDGLSATGTGRSKKDAKHEAAKAMLETIAKHRAYPQLPASVTQSPIRTPVASIPVCPKAPSNVPFMNAIGALKALCHDSNLQEPEYIQISDVGPPHERIFTVQCVVASFKEEAAATTKKQAKHEAAKKMLGRIKDLVGNLDSTEKDNIETQDEEGDIERIKKFVTLSKHYLSRKIDFGVKLSEVHNSFKHNFPESSREQVLEKLRSIAVHNHDDDMEDLCSNLIPKIKETLQILNLNLIETELTMSKENVHCVAAVVDSTPTFASVGKGASKSEATINGVLTLINRLICFLE